MIDDYGDEVEQQNIPNTPKGYGRRSDDYKFASHDDVRELFDTTNKQGHDIARIIASQKTMSQDIGDIKNSLKALSSTNWQPFSLAVTVIIAAVGLMGWIQTTQLNALNDMSDMQDEAIIDVQERQSQILEDITRSVVDIKAKSFTTEDWRYEKSDLVDRLNTRITTLETRINEIGNDLDQAEHSYGRQQ